MSRTGALVGSVAAALVVGLLPALAATSAAPAAAGAPFVDHSKGTPGFCPSGVGVTVVIDFQELGGDTIVRCNPTGRRGTGLDALKGAGIQVAGVQRWGEAFICRIENRPSAVEKLPISNDPGYRESCINTPPARAYWSYWHAGNNCPWLYSQWGVKNRDFVQGGFEGWSFSLNATADSNPRPRIAAVRPGTAGGRCTAKAEPGPKTNDPQEKQPGSAADNGYKPDPTYGQDGKVSADPHDPDRPENRPSSQPGATPGAGTSAPRPLPAPRPRAESTAPVPDDPSDNVDFTGGQAAPDVRDVIKKQANASDAAPWVAAAAIAFLAATAYLTARRRRRLREDA